MVFPQVTTILTQSFVLSVIAVRHLFDALLCVVLQVLLSRDLPHPFGLTVHGEFVYWTDWETRSIERAHKVDGSSRRVVAARLESLMDLHMFHRHRPQGQSSSTLRSAGIGRKVRRHRLQGHSSLAARSFVIDC